MKINTTSFAASGLKVAAVTALFVGGAALPSSAQNYCASTGNCSNRTIEAVNSNPYQVWAAESEKAEGQKRGVKSVLLFDQAPGHGSGKQALRRSLSRLSQKYGFRLEITDQNGYISAATLQGVDIVVFSQGDGDVLGGATSASTVAMENFTYAQGGSVLMVHAAAAYIPCPTSGGQDLGNANCRFLARAAARQYLQHQADNTPVRIYADSVFAGQVPPHQSLGGTAPTPPASVIDHGRRNIETKNIFDNSLPNNAKLPPNSAEDPRTHVWDHVGCEWYNYLSSPRTVGNFVRNVGGVDYLEQRVNILLSQDETSRNIGGQRMGDHPQAWTRKMGRGLSAYQNAGHSDVYVRIRGSQSGVTLPGGAAFGQDSLIEKFNWNLLRYLARDYVGCMDSAYAEYNAEASVTSLTEADPAEQCVTPVSIVRSGARSDAFPGLRVQGRAFEIATPEDGFYRVMVSDMRGRMVYSRTVVGGASSSVQVADLSKGSYFVNMTTPDRQRRVVRVDI